MVHFARLLRNFSSLPKLLFFISTVLQLLASNVCVFWLLLISSSFFEAFVVFFLIKSHGLMFSCCWVPF